MVRLLLSSGYHHKPRGIRPNSPIGAMVADKLLKDAEIIFLLTESRNDGCVLQQKDQVLLALVVLDCIILGIMNIAKSGKLEFLRILFLQATVRTKGLSSSKGLYQIGFITLANLLRQKYAILHQDSGSFGCVERGVPT